MDFEEIIRNDHLSINTRVLFLKLLLGAYDRISKKWVYIFKTIDCLAIFRKKCMAFIKLLVEYKVAIFIRLTEILYENYHILIGYLSL